MNAQLKQKIAEITEQCAAPGWDGYGANAVTPEAVAQARAFADAIPPHLLSQFAGRKRFETECPRN